MRESAPTIYYDGHCALCSGFVQAILRVDERGYWRFAPLQSAFAKTHLAPYGIDPGALTTVIAEDRGHIYVKSDAALRVASRLGWPWRAAAALRVLPKGLRDGVYDVVARYRYRVFGEREACYLPKTEWRGRFLGEG